MHPDWTVEKCTAFLIRSPTGVRPGNAKPNAVPDLPVSDKQPINGDFEGFHFGLIRTSARGFSRARSGKIEGSSRALSFFFFSCIHEPRSAAIEACNPKQNSCVLGGLHGKGDTPCWAKSLERSE